MQGEQQVSDTSSSDIAEQQAHVQGEQQDSDASSCDTVDLPIALRKEPRAKSGKPPKKYRDEQDTIVAKKTLQNIRDDHDIGNFVSYEALSLS